MLERAATALDRQLSPSEQATVLSHAARRLPYRPGTNRPLTTALSALEATGLLQGYAVEAVPDGPGRRTKRVTLDGYRPSLADGRCPVLPLVVELLRYTTVTPRIDEATQSPTGLELVVSLTGDTPASGLCIAAVDG